MGDHRISVKIDFAMHGHEATQDFWLNWSRDGDIPRPITEWICEQRDIAIRCFDDEQDKAESEHRERQRRLAETAANKLTAEELDALLSSKP